MDKDNFNMALIGFGTWKLPNSEETIEIVKNAIDSGYRLIDTAKAYGNENYIGRGIKASSIKREELFITGKLWNSDRDNVEEACISTISNLGCDYLDLYLMHWPASKVVHEDWILINKRVWEQLEKLYDKDIPIRTLIEEELIGYNTPFENKVKIGLLEKRFTELDCKKELTTEDREEIKITNYTAKILLDDMGLKEEDFIVDKEDLFNMSKEFTNLEETKVKKLTNLEIKRKIKYI